MYVRQVGTKVHVPTPISAHFLNSFFLQLIFFSSYSHPRLYSECRLLPYSFMNIFCEYSLDMSQTVIPIHINIPSYYFGNNP
jgi:hypothetical protein